MSTSYNFEETRGKVITCKAAVAWAPKQPLEVTDIEVQPPQPFEVRIKVFCNALCHTDVSYIDGSSSEGAFPCIVGHEATGIVESIGEGVTTVVPGDIIIPCYTPECREYDCIYCQSPVTNLCPKIRANQGNGLMPDGTTRFSKDGKKIYHFMGCSTFSEYTVIAEISCAKINPDMDVKKACLLGCGIATGWGAAVNTCKVTPGSSVVVFGLGAVGLAVIQAAKAAGASKILAVDVNEAKFQKAKVLGATDFFNPKELPQGTTVVSHLLSKEKWGYHFTFDCTGNTKVMRDALEISHRGFGESCVIGVAAAGHEIATRSFQLVTGRVWKGTAFGGWKSRTEVPKLVKKVLRGEAPLDEYVTHVFEGLEHTNKSVEILNAGESIRSIIVLDKNIVEPSKPNITIKENIRCFNGWIKRVRHWSEANQCDMDFSIYIPDSKQRTAPNPPVLYYLSGLTCTDENALVKSGFAREASQWGLSVVFPDTSCRGVEIEGMKDDWTFGLSASYYVDATTEKWRKNNNMYTYITKELPQVLNNYFDVDTTRASITGHSMGGHGALVAYLRNQEKYKSCSAFAPISHPTAVPFTQKAFEGYLGDVAAGEAYDACHLVKKAKAGPEILIDQGTSDKFYLNGTLQPESFVKACAEAKYPVKLRMQPNFDHSYFFVSSFIADHISLHAKALGL